MIKVSTVNDKSIVTLITLHTLKELCQFIKKYNEVRIILHKQLISINEEYT